MKLHVASSLAEVNSQDWNRLAGTDPFLQHAFLHALHDTGCASPETGWSPQYLLLRDGDTLAGAMPLYLKSHSRGEYVFDWAWADAYHRHSIEYYPKLLCAIPYTPVVGARLLVQQPEYRDLLITGALELARQTKTSSLHVLFPAAADLECLSRHGLLLRQGCQFHWENNNYANFDAFLAQLNHDKRKKIRQERRKVREAGITLRWIEGDHITDADWEFFTRCYDQTYHEHRATPYLNLAFFQRIGAAMPSNIVLIRADRNNHPIATALLIRNGTHLYGRHWGAIEHHPALHFEACYYQGIEYAIARGLQTFEGGAQGEHKMARGLLPVAMQSAHWLAHPEFSSAVDQFLRREGPSVSQYIDELHERSPFKMPATQNSGD